MHKIDIYKDTIIHVQSNLLQNYECPLRCYDELRYIGLCYNGVTV